MPDGQQTIIDVHVLLVRAGDVLFTQRRGAYGGGMRHLPSGKLEADESLLAGAAREAEEEVGALIDPDDLRHAHTVHVAGSGPAPRLGVFFEARRWVGEPANRYPGTHRLWPSQVRAMQPGTVPLRGYQQRIPIMRRLRLDTSCS
jgi:8-oxo-dGTP diphosphatase